MDEKQVPARVVPPGRIIQREIDARGWSQRDLAAIINRPAQAINEIINGTKQITPETAIELGAAFSTTAELWMNLEVNYRLWLAHKAKKEEEITKRSRIYSLAPVRELQKRGWIAVSPKLEDLEQEICRFLGIHSLEESVQCTASFRCSAKKQIDPSSRFAWLKRVEYLASKQSSRTYNRKTLEDSLPELLSLAAQAEDIGKIPMWLNEIGVSLVLVKHLPKTYTDGAAFFMGARPIIALTLRYNRLDSFWFTLCHELAHILYGNGRTFIDEDVYDTEEEVGEDSITAEEKMADEKAKNWLLESKEYNQFVKKTDPYFSETVVLDFALRQNRHPSIVVGRLKHEGLIPPQNLNKLNVKPTDFLPSTLIM